MLLYTPSQAFARLDRAHAAWTRGGATVAVTSATSGGTRKARFRLDLDGAGGAVLRIMNPGVGRVAATDQAFVLRGARVVGYDLLANESIRRPAPDRGSPGLRLTAVLGGLEDAVGFLASPEVRERYLAPLRKIQGWKTTPTGLARRSSGKFGTSLTRLDVDTSGRLRRLHIELPGSRLDWSFVYGPYRPFTAPRGARLVEAFTERNRPPRYADANARKAGGRMLRAGARLGSAIVRLDGAATLWIDGSRVRYEAGGSGFAYDGRTLTVRTPRSVYAGRSSRRAVIDVVAALLGDVDPFVRSVLVRASPFEPLFPPEARVRVVGTMATAGQACDVLDVSTPRFRASVFSRKRDGLPLSIENSVLNARGEVLASTRRTFGWISTGTPLAPALFALRVRAGARPLPLPTAP